jgi:thymidine phosphorylase
VLSKKAAAGSTNVLIDIPVGKTAKVRSNEEALRLQYYFKAVGEAIGLSVSVMITDGSQPVGRGIGPALEVIDVLAVLRNETDAPADLRERALDLAGALLDMSGAYPGKEGKDLARNILLSGKAYEKFKAICEAQGAFREPKAGSYHYDILAESSGIVREIDNRKLARIAKLAGAPRAAGAGVLFLAPLGRAVNKGDLLFRIYAEADGELEYAIEYLKTDTDIIRIEA